MPHDTPPRRSGKETEMDAATRNDYAARALAVQNHPANWNVDITTFVHMAATESQVKRHVEDYEARAALANVNGGAA